MNPITFYKVQSTLSPMEYAVAPRKNSKPRPRTIWTRSTMWTLQTLTGWLSAASQQAPFDETRMTVAMRAQLIITLWLCRVSFVEGCCALCDAMTGNMSNTDHVPVYAYFKTHLPTQHKNLLPNQLNAATRQMPEKRSALLDAVAVRTNTTTSMQTSETSAGEQWKVIKTMVNDGIWKKLERRL